MSFVCFLLGVGIGFHVDTHSAFVGGIATVSLSGDVVMEFRKNIPSDIGEIELPPDTQFGLMELLGIGSHSAVTHTELACMIQELTMRRGESRESNEKVNKGSNEEIINKRSYEEANYSGSPDTSKAETIVGAVTNSSGIVPPPQLSFCTSNQHRVIDLGHRGKIVSRLLKVLRRNSACCFDGELRYAYEHGIASRFTDQIDGTIQQRARRVSITFRTIRPPSQLECDCSWSLWCDSQNSRCHRTPTRLTKTE